MTPDALLYLVAFLDYYRIKKSNCRISGNVPTDTRCKRLLIQSGFFDYVHSKGIPKDRSVRILKIEKHSLVEGPLAKNILLFCMRHLGEENRKQLRDVYRTILELMNNTRDHAYPEDREKLRWYIMAVYDANTTSLTVSFLDTGVGIPATIRRKFSEKIRDIMGQVPGISQTAPKQNVLIRSALAGDFRTRTDEGYRGKGLPSIYKCFEGGSVRNLTIVSNQAYLNLASETGYDLVKGLRGSLYSWTMG